MSDLRPSINPYAPPAALVPEKLQHASYLWREGDLLVLRTGVELPCYCMVTGGAAHYSHPVSQIWQPKWIYLLLLLAVIPYFVLSPFLHQRVELTVPFGKPLYRKHQRWVNFGIVLMLTGGLMVIGFVVSAVGHWLSAPVAIMLVGGVFLFLIGLQTASSSPLRLDIIKVEDDLIFVDKVHPDYLARLPNALDPATPKLKL